MDNALEDLFDSLTAGKIQEMVDNRVQEGLRLDFTRFSKNDGKALATMVSAFGNSDGGILIFGIGTTAVDGGADAASETAPTPEVNRVAEGLRASLINTVSPPVPGVRIEPIPTTDGCGYVAVLVPSSVVGPHMDLPRHWYQRRYGNRTRPMQNLEIADMFGRRAKPLLHATMEWKEPYVTFDPPGLDFHRRGVKVTALGSLLVTNTGTAAAHSPAVGISQPNGGFRIEVGQGAFFGIQSATPGVEFFEYHPGRVIHPTRSLPACSVTVSGDLNATPIANATIQCRLYADGMEAVEDRIEVDLPDIWARAIKRIDSDPAVAAEFAEVRMHNAKLRSMGP